MEYGPPPLFRQGVPARARFIFFVLVSLVLMLVDGRLRALDGFRGAVVSFTEPLTELVALPGELLGRGEGYFVSKRNLSNENARLSEENQKLLLRAARYAELEEENRVLRELVGAVPRTSSRVVTAEVLGRVADNFSRRIRINLGEKDGLKLGMPVIGASGALGQVSRVIPHLSEVTLITDHNQQIAVMNERTHERYIAAGTGEVLLDVLFVKPDADIRPGDLLVTTGLDGLFPRNVAVAEISAVDHEPQESYQRVTASPLFEMHELQFATIILTDPNPTAALDEVEEEPLQRRKRR